jgi:DNA mismatch repair protein MutH
MKKLVYDDSNIDSIIDFARRLESSTIHETNFEHHTYAGVDRDIPKEDGINPRDKGSFGNYLETAYFGKENNNKSLPDFPKAKLELKTSPLKIIGNYEVKVKERLVLNHFTYNDLDKEVFDKSHFKDKNENILLVFYSYNPKLFVGDLHIELVDLWKCLEADEYQIRLDWETIVEKIHQGKAHEISEGDTLYLGACTKGATAASSLQTQPHSEIKAKGRAFCFKLGYINHIFQVLMERKRKGRPHESRFLSKNEKFEQKIISLFMPYMNKLADEISKLRNRDYNPKDKSRYANLARSIVGLNNKQDNFYEFNASGIQFKTIRVESNGKINESISFKAIDYNEIIDEEWEDSYFYSAITSKFIFVLFKRDTAEGEYYLDRVEFWQIPENDYKQFEKVWSDTKEKVKKGDYQHFSKIKDNPVSHVRPHGKDSHDLVLSPQGTYEKKMCFWINQQYIQENVIDKIYKR